MACPLPGRWAGCGKPCRSSGGFFAGEKVDFQGEHFQIPLPGGDARPMRLSMSPNEDIPIYLATLSPKMLRLTGEVADGWLGTSFVPEGAADAYFSHLAEGARISGRKLEDLDICQGAEVCFAADEEELRTMVGSRKKELAFSLGGMGSATTNFYNAAYSRQGAGRRWRRGYGRVGWPAGGTTRPLW